MTSAYLPFLPMPYLAFHAGEPNAGLAGAGAGFDVALVAELAGFDVDLPDLAMVAS
jgi:hypothetical protein